MNTRDLKHVLIRALDIALVDRVVRLKSSNINDMSSLDIHSLKNEIKNLELAKQILTGERKVK